MTLNSGDIHGSKMWLQVGSRECVCVSRGVGGGGQLKVSVNENFRTLPDFVFFGFLA